MFSVSSEGREFMSLANSCLLLVDSIISFLLDVWMAILNATGLGFWWLASVILFIVFSVVFVPMRSGQLLGGGAIATFTTNKISSAKRNREAEERRNTPQLKFHLHHHVHTRNGGKK